ncbi:hypothetical protein AWJ20_1260 [Sugiyamaella lignohabitans]|uniref:Uncharacterized protein n=1 Tax=Sugiyamaella lignohabitans TaxID=796027 RepID=A0A167DJG9_9ASCO|nr:uncharacterized protein AWJ20_1260 [Sugiyamaella lignohabitans]ANB12982.1 hypothetical protein AWJ20_1260 [Sugiyamaella lignohabitans]
MLSNASFISLEQPITVTTIFTTIVVLVVSSIVAAYAYELYREYDYARKSKKRGLGKPYTVMNRPFGIFSFLRLMKSSKHNKLLPEIRRGLESVPRLTFRAQNMFTVNIMTQDPENVKSILATDFKSYSTGLRYKQLSPLLGRGIFTSNGDYWKHSRAMLRPQFSRERISHLHLYEKHVQKLLDILKKGPDGITDTGSGSSFNEDDHAGLVDVQNLFLKFTMDTSSEFLFGQSMESLSPHDSILRTSRSEYKSSDFMKAADFCSKTLANRARAGALYFLFNSKEFRNCIKTVHDFVDDVITDTLNKEKKGDDDATSFLEELSLQTRDPIELRSQALNVLLAGRSTTAGLLSFTIYLLVRHKRVFNRLRGTVLEAFGTDEEAITYESIKRCTYLQYVLNEALRIYPLVPLNVRYAIKDTSLPRGGGELEDQPVFVPKGTQIVYPVFMIHRLKQFWGPDAEEFRPERWYENSYHTWDFLPFNGGPRICIGQQFALSEASYVIVRLLQNFKDITTSQDVLDRELLLRASVSTNVYGGVWAKFVQ